MTLLRTALLNAMDPIPPVDMGSATGLTLLVSLGPDTAVDDPLMAGQILFAGATAKLELVALQKTLRAVTPLPDIGVDHAGAMALAQAGLHDQAAVAFLRLAVRHDAPIIAIYGLATQLFKAGQVRQALHVAQFLVSIWTDDPRPLALLGTVQGELSAVRDARNSLALAAHLSRRDPGFRGVLRYSQRELLKLQFHDHVDTQSGKV